MIKILDTSKTLAELATDETNGLGFIQPMTAFVTEELNGIYEAEFTVSADEKRFDQLSVGGIVSINAGETEGEQMFRIYSISLPMNGVVSVKACHITYDLNKIVVRPFTATGATNAKNGMMANAINLGAFTMTTNISNTASEFKLTIPRSFRECLGGYEGSLLDVFRGEYEWDNLNVAMLSKRGADNGVHIRYGKNLVDFQQEENNANIFTSVLGYAVVNERTYVGNVYDKVTGVPQRIKIVDFSSDYQSDETPTTAQLTTKAQTYATNNPIEVPTINISLSFVPLSRSLEYRNIASLERVNLGDTVYVDFPKLNVTASSRVVKRTWDAVKDRYDSIELGSMKSNLSTVINSAVSEAVGSIDVDVDGAVSFVQDQLDTLTRLITNGLGLHFTAVQSTDGGYIYYLHNKTLLADSDIQYRMGANGILVSTDYGATWNAGFDAQGNAVLNSLASITLKALEIYGSQIYFGDPDNKYILAQNYNQNGTQIGISFDGTGSTRFQPQSTFEVVNLDANGNSYNELSMSYSSADDYAGETSLKNYSNGRLATEIRMDADQYTSRLREFIYRWNNANRTEVVKESVSEEYNVYDHTRISNNLYSVGYLNLDYNRTTATSTAQMRAYRNGGYATTYADITETGSANPSVNISAIANGVGSVLDITNTNIDMTASDFQISDGTHTYDLFDSIFPYRGNLSGSSYDYAIALGSWYAPAGTIGYPDDGTHAFRLFVFVQGVIFQIAVANSTADLLFWRVKTTGDNWSAWRQITDLITGVKGNAESSYRTGNVNLTPANIGAVPTGRTVNGHALSSNVTVTASDIGLDSWSSVTSYNLTADERNTEDITTWSNYNLRKVGNVVTLHLRFTTGSTYTNDMNIATLPEGYRPPYQGYFVMGDLNDRSTTGICRITTAGVVQFAGSRGQASHQYALIATYIVA